MNSIFDIKHIKEQSYFLNVQCSFSLTSLSCPFTQLFVDRMPSPIGHFISTHVYEGRLLSHHKVHSKRCLAFIHADGIEAKSGKSHRNAKEVQTVTHLVRNYYRSFNFAIITPYDAQRAAIVAGLKGAHLPWEGRVFNVDSFQGNEADIVIVSVVRTNGPGFLKNLNRTNVLLTRCKMGMIIVTNRSFIYGGGKKTLLGKLAGYWEKRESGEGKLNWVDWRRVAEGKAKLPSEALYEELEDHRCSGQ
ncbi:hypothetical protein M422DRAFT_151005 [Sphaerobolus stellatus SS14]|nr:hypothetical protein M422DRAFT_151005 [Sphaerobolus stellatus SS14]